MSSRKVNLGELVKHFSVLAKNYKSTYNLDFYGVSNNFGIIKAKYAAEEKAEDYKIIEKGCFAYNPYRVNVGSIGFVNEDIIGLISPAYVVFKLKHESIIPELLLKFLKSSEGLRQIKQHARGTVRKALRFEDLCKIELSIPNYDKQVILFDKLKHNEVIISQLKIEFDYQMDLLKKLRQQILQDSIRGKLVSQNDYDEPASILLDKIKAEKEQLIKEKKIKKDKPLLPIKPEEIPFDIPEGWIWCRLGEIFNFIDYRGKTPTRTLSGVRLISAKNIRFGHISNNPIEYVSNEEYKKWMVRGFPKNGDILFVTEGHTMGFVAIIDLKFDYILAQRTICLQPIGNSYAKFVFYYLLNSSVQKFIKTLATGSAAMGIQSAKLKQLLIPIPSISEQSFIISKIEQLMLFSDSLEESIKQNQHYTDLLKKIILSNALKSEPLSTLSI